MGKKRGVLSLALLVLCVSLCCLGIQSSPVYAGEGYGSHYPGGNEDFMAGALPPAGTSIFINYLVDYNASTLKDNAGRNATAGAPPSGLKTNFNLNVLVDAMRYVSVTKLHILGGDLVWHVIVPVGYEHVSLQAVVPGFGTAYGPGFPSSKTGLGDIEPGIGIAWHHSKTLHSVFAVDVVMPTGQYGSAPGSGSSSRTFIADPANLGRNYWSIDPLYAITYIGDKSSPIPGLELSAKFMYWINTVNSATGYVSGQEFSADYLLGYHINKKLAIGANGFYRMQTTDDKQFGKTAYDPLTGLQTGVRGNVMSIGPAITYEIPHGCLTFKWQHDIYAQDRKSVV